MPTLSDVARQAGVSTATVSRTFNTPQLLNDETRRRVLDAAAALQYKPRSHKLAPGRKGGRRVRLVSDAIGFQFFSSALDDSVRDNLFYAPLLSGAQAEAAELGLNLLVSQTNRHQVGEKLPKMIRERAVSGMLLVGTADAEILATFLRLVPHIVLVDEPDEEGNHDCILSDGFDGALQATRHLLELGHRRIAFLLGDAVPTFRERYHGYICAFHDAGLAPDPRLTMEGEITPNCRLVDILRGPDRATGLIVANDWHALAAMKICNEMGLSIPGDVSIIGFDDIEFSSHAVPPLSTVRVDKEYMGRLAVRRIQFRLAEDRLNPEPAILIKTAAQLVLREWCGPPPSHG